MFYNYFNMYNYNCFCVNCLACHVWTSIKDILTYLDILTHLAIQNVLLIKMGRIVGRDGSRVKNACEIEEVGR